MSLSRDEIESDLSPMQQFYWKKSVLITGATGFLGQVIIEKLLRSCNVEFIYILIRAKKDENIKKRFEKLLNNPLFDVVRKVDPNFCKKVIPINGDCTITGLGITEEDRKILTENVNFIFHSAATVRFNEKLKNAFRINVLGTFEALNLAKEIKHLKAFVHVSTAYAFCKKIHIEEKVYPLEKEASDLIENFNSYDTEEWENLELETLKTWPNTYTFTKALAENYVKSQGKVLPISIFRPAVIGATYGNKIGEPILGWIDKPTGVVGFGLSMAYGALGVSFTDGSSRMEIVPVDFCANILLQIAYDVSKKSYDIPQVFNYTTIKGNIITIQEFTDHVSLYLNDYPFSKAIWYSRVTLTVNPLVFEVLNFFNHKLPCVIADLIMTLRGKKTKFVQKYQRLSKYSESYRYFINTKFDFDNDNVKNLYASLDKKDKEIFNSDMEAIDWVTYVKRGVSGTRLYLMKDGPETIPEAIKRRRKLKILHYTVVISFSSLLIYAFSKLFSMIF